jgi:hypothetical protein
MPGGAQLDTVIRGCSWMMSVLATVRESELPDAWVGAGTLRDLVWGELFGSGFDPALVHDVDVAFFDPGDVTRAGDERATRRLCELRADVPWEATNQAAVHLWFSDVFDGGSPVEPLTSIEDAVGTWPESVTSVAVRLACSGDLQLCAPLGLRDMLAGVWRRNARRVSVTQSRARLDRHRPAARWPGVQVVPPEVDAITVA